MTIAAGTKLGPYEIQSPPRRGRHGERYTELQAHFKFDDNGARINGRIHEMWNVLMPLFDVKELYKERYEKLMKDRGIFAV